LSFYFTGVNETLKQSETLLEKKYLAKRPIEELVEIVAGKLGHKPAIPAYSLKAEKQGILEFMFRKLLT